MSRNGRRQSTKSAARKSAQGATKHAKRKAWRMVTPHRRNKPIPVAEPLSNVTAVELDVPRSLDTLAEIASSPCPTCGATGAHNCVTAGGKPTKDHAKRVRA
jgi:hypothetical protein